MHRLHKQVDVVLLKKNQAPCSKLRTLSQQLLCYSSKEINYFVFVIDELFFNSLITLPCIAREALFEQNTQKYLSNCSIMLSPINFLWQISVDFLEYFLFMFYRRYTADKQWYRPKRLSGIAYLFELKGVSSEQNVEQP